MAAEEAGVWKVPRMRAFVWIVVPALAVMAALVPGTNPGEAQEATALPVPSPRCARPNVPATVIRPVEPDTPAMAQQQGIVGSVAVVVTLDESSRVVAARIQSSPSVILNSAALAAARASQYQTEIRDCRPRAGDFVRTVDFASDTVQPAAAPSAGLLRIMPPGTVERGVTPAGEPTIVVGAQAVVRRAPDRAHVYAAIVTQDDETAAAAASRNDAIFAAVTAKLHAAGVDDTQIHVTSASAFSPRPSPMPGSRANTPSIPRYGYRSSRQLVITLAAVERGPAVADAASAAGATSVGVRYDSTDREAAYREALRNAVKAARARAEAVALSGGVQLGKVYQIVVTQADVVSPNAYSGLPSPFEGLYRLVSSPTLVEVRAGVTVTYFIKP